MGNKKRLYIAVYPSGVVGNEERRYHWAFLIGPKAEKGQSARGKRFHVKNEPLTGWTYEEKDVADVKQTTTLLGRVLIAKIEDEQRLVDLLRNQPVVNGDPNWRCRSWVASALEAVARDGRCVGRAELDWGRIEPFVRGYIGRKREEGRYERPEDLARPRPTYDLLEGKETIV
ncbi:uncharacterized protein EI97DRAFT_159017 [Westerdykella ornata]|uniref:Uncharacterized protein n=1 Tax=Westerdykella ornata TaxID=318751 RepID=A0A6A6JBB3_WESOR|nr:uncharacterized protein EI97DRAFT_159017 [Westerdykella ornata]KAF2273473.1 hypothetical protein EI97DRAFT_159017 [Westerdykella ornata]